MINVDWDGATLTLFLDRPVTREWVNALQNMGSFSSVLGKPPHAFTFSNDRASSRAAAHEIQLIVDNFKVWLPLASQTLKGILERRAQQQEAAEKARLRREGEIEEQRLRVLRNTRI